MKVVVSHVGSGVETYYMSGGNASIATKRYYYCSAVVPDSEMRSYEADIPLPSEVFLTQSDTIASALDVLTPVEGIVLPRKGEKDFHINPVLQVKAQSQVYGRYSYQSRDKATYPNIANPWNPSYVRHLYPGDIFTDRFHEDDRDYYIKMYVLDDGDHYHMVRCAAVSGFTGARSKYMEVATIEQDNGYEYTSSYSWDLTQVFSKDVSWEYFNQRMDELFAKNQGFWSDWHRSTRLRGNKWSDRPHVTRHDPILAADFASMANSELVRLTHTLKDRHGQLSNSSLCYDAVQDIGLFEGNGIAYLKDALELGSSFKNFAKTLSTIPKHLVKGSAQTYLSCHYGFKLSYLDTLDIIKHQHDDIGTHDLRRVSSHHTLVDDNIIHDSRYHIYFDDTPFWDDQLAALATKYDLNLSLENVWDMVPYSFVIDWFASVGDILNSWNNMYTLESRYKLLGFCRSDAATEDVNLRDIGSQYEGYFSAKAYLRYGGRSVATPIPDSSQVIMTTSPFNHTVEGAALLVSK